MVRVRSAPILSEKKHTHLRPGFNEITTWLPSKGQAYYVFRFITTSWRFGKLIRDAYFFPHLSICLKMVQAKISKIDILTAFFYEKHVSAIPESWRFGTTKFHSACSLLQWTTPLRLTHLMRCKMEESHLESRWCPCLTCLLWFLYHWIDWP